MSETIIPDAFAELKLQVAKVRGIKANLAYLKVLCPQKGIPANRKSLYFIVCGDAVKIGVSSDPVSRLATLATGSPCPLNLLAEIPNAGDREAECHKRMKHLRLSGEWFRYTEEVDCLIKELQSAKD